jgi:hypothetical protein
MDRKRFVLILADPEDEHALYVKGLLTDEKHVVRILDTSRFPSDFALSYGPQSNSARIEFDDGPILDWNDIHSIYWRQFTGVAESTLPDAEQACIAENDSRSLVESMLFALPGKWVNSYRAWRMHQVKPAQLAKVCSLHLDPIIKIPRTLLTNSPLELKAFAKSVGQCIFKPVQGGAHTQKLKPSHLRGKHLDNLKHAPITLQEHISGTDIRVFVAGRKVMACRIESASLDFRDDPDPKIEPHALSREVADACCRIARALNLVWTGIDLRLTENGDFFFFEANPSPMFMGFESRSRLPLTETLINLLIK